MAAEYENTTFKLRKFPLSSDGNFTITPEMQKHFDEFGFIAVSGLLPRDELSKFTMLMEAPATAKYMYEIVVENFADDKGEPVKLTLWNNLDDGYPGVIAASEKVAGTWDQLFDQEMYHYHSKMVMKNIGEGTKNVFNWHQDYGYWYMNNNIKPDMGTTWLAIDRADRDNGCLKIIPGSHKCGRIDHIKHDQVMADNDRVTEVLKRLGGWIYVELDPGDALFFHSNILHRSEANLSDKRRWAFLCSFNAAANDPPKHHHASYGKLNKLPNSALKQEAKLPTNCEFMTIYPHDKSDKTAQLVH